ncbi:hypothetical protein DFA_00238 [Cavenderia fasciculata]|uniref:Transmembrane protein n=1 Tax=Cavenderia fasciculata TaxID=261658 RepID=F4PY00_CACFS|nr:uncharacterized protein DFA_00238 [Cavenderia fasciculata]EGG19660.1 hypothetical protein DFA_00238 [Cavenderia fasciculata]|eukprot:XP_004357954.1 hypothetical protein DFA_00238 [Cavenderia fasciculata]
MENEIVSNIFGILGSIIWSVQLIPQIKLNYKNASTQGLSPYCFMSWYLCGLILGTYLIHEKSPVSLIIQILLFTSFCLIIIFQYLFYEKQFPRKKLGIWFSGTLVISVAVGGIIYGVMSAATNGRPDNKVVSTIVTVLATTLMFVGFLPQIKEIYDRKSSVGISKIFVVMDACGGIASILSLAFDLPFDFFAFSTYVVVPIFQAVQFVMLIYYDHFYTGKGPRHQIPDSTPSVGGFDDQEDTTTGGQNIDMDEGDANFGCPPIVMQKLISHDQIIDMDRSPVILAATILDKNNQQFQQLHQQIRPVEINI